ncbi:MAG: putative Universal stress protein [Candidatus Nitrospira kreftii]|uniref:Putative Universal stress protein n=1 Tax=Candidatus Nitrospira kreftii TaxID=2652173 RepID=A0A7S8FB25_9BACT|nr:MAG: putative Universal stress protein [Candidatus Nitrospira kreftii]
MRRDSNLFNTILVPVDFSPCSDEAFGVACQMARLCGAAILILHVIDTSALAAFNRLGLLAVPSDATAQHRRLRHHARLNVRQLLESKEAEALKVTRMIVEGAPFVEIAKVARTGNIDLVVMGSYGGRSGSVDKIFFGSTAEKVVRTAGCPVLTVPIPVSAPQRRVSR